MKTEILQGDCLERMKELPDDSVCAVVTDPPYGLSFMGKGWDKGVPPVDVWRECFRVLKPGGHLLAFAGTRTQHRMATNIEDAGFEIRDMIAWVYGSGFPKSLDISKAIDKAKGAEREVVGKKRGAGKPGTNTATGNQTFVAKNQHEDGTHNITAPATEEAKEWDGWGTAIKPALEPITLARKPFTGTVANNVLKHGTGGLNIDGCRVGTDGGTETTAPKWKNKTKNAYGDGLGAQGGKILRVNKGRFPANFIHDGSEEVTRLFPMTGASVANKQSDGRDHAQNKIYGNGKGWGRHDENNSHSDCGSASRFFYCAKADKSDREFGLSGSRNFHATVKPIDLMRYLCRLVTPPNGTVLDPFTGSGTTGIAAVLEGFNFIGMEKEADYYEMAKARIEYATAKAKEGVEPRTAEEVKKAGGQLSILDQL